ncbi:hypothetical protein QY96_00520 [Bacillus thermotolerans]|nr:hypothetical protein QY96_00520 [Bacillus thermotolerans]
MYSHNKRPDIRPFIVILLIKSSVNGQTVKKYVESPQNT